MPKPVTSPFPSEAAGTVQFSHCLRRGMENSEGSQMWMMCTCIQRVYHIDVLHYILKQGLKYLLVYLQVDIIPKFDLWDAFATVLSNSPMRMCNIYIQLYTYIYICIYCTHNFYIYRYTSPVIKCGVLKNPPFLGHFPSDTETSQVHHLG